MKSIIIFLCLTTALIASVSCAPWFDLFAKPQVHYGGYYRPDSEGYYRPDAGGYYRPDAGGYYGSNYGGYYRPQQKRQGKSGGQRWKEICRTINADNFANGGASPYPAAPVCPF